MSALLTWPARAKKPPHTVGDQRTVQRFLLLPKCLSGEWRWLGVESIVQEFQRYMAIPPDMPAMMVVGWRDVWWSDRAPAAKKIRIRQPPRKP